MKQTRPNYEALDQNGQPIMRAAHIIGELPPSGMRQGYRRNRATVGLAGVAPYRLRIAGIDGTHDRAGSQASAS